MGASPGAGVAAGTQPAAVKTIDHGLADATEASNTKTTRAAAAKVRGEGALCFDVVDAPSLADAP
jgi:hypothetical protein